MLLTFLAILYNLFYKNVDGENSLDYFSNFNIFVTNQFIKYAHGIPIHVYIIYILEVYID